jgi:hypothetical protein
MTARKLIRWGTAGAVALVVCAGAAPAQAAGNTAIDRGGAYCLRMGTTVPGATSTVFSLDIDPADHPTKQRLWWVSGVEKGTNPDVATQNYVNLLNGTATLAKPNNGRPGGQIIHMALSGTSYGTYLDVNEPGIWEQHYNLQLNPKTLQGTITGLSVFTPISGTTAGPATTLAFSERIAAMNCKNL